jgi:hypothetical protein
MSNVIQLFRQEKAVNPLDPNAVVTFAVSDILASHAELARTIKALSKHLDALDYFTDSLSNSDTLALFKQETNRSRESLTNALVDLSQ